VAGTLIRDAGGRLGSARPVNPQAYDTYLRGVQARFRGTEADLRESLRLFDEAIALDAAFAPAHQRRCDTLAVLGFTGWGAEPPRDATPRARASCLEALKLDASLAAAQAGLGSIALFYDWDLSAADVAFERALQLGPSDQGVLPRSAWFQSVRGRHAEALALSQKAELLDPLSVSASTNHGWLLYWARQYDAAASQLRKVLQQRPDAPVANLMLAIVYLQNSTPDQAAAQAERAAKLAGGTSATVAQLGHVYGVAGRRMQAERVLGELVARSKREYVASYWIALVHHGLGQEQACLDRLERAFSDREALPLLDVEPRWDGLRSNPRFQDLRRRVGLPATSFPGAAR
jgi:tetratricopeptide (TPR) repeat protein